MPEDRPSGGQKAGPGLEGLLCVLSLHLCLVGGECVGTGWDGVGRGTRVRACVCVRHRAAVGRGMRPAGEWARPADKGRGRGGGFAGSSHVTGAAGHRRTCRFSCPVRQHLAGRGHLCLCVRARACLCGWGIVHLGGAARRTSSSCRAAARQDDDGRAAGPAHGSVHDGRAAGPAGRPLAAYMGGRPKPPCSGGVHGGAGPAPNLPGLPPPSHTPSPPTTKKPSPPLPPPSPVDTAVAERRHVGVRHVGALPALPFPFPPLPRCLTAQCLSCTWCRRVSPPWYTQSRATKPR